MLLCWWTLRDGSPLRDENEIATIWSLHSLQTVDILGNELWLLTLRKLGLLTLRELEHVLHFGM